MRRRSVRVVAGTLGCLLLLASAQMVRRIWTESRGAVSGQASRAAEYIDVVDAEEDDVMVADHGRASAAEGDLASHAENGGFSNSAHHSAEPSPALVEEPKGKAQPVSVDSVQSLSVEDESKLVSIEDGSSQKKNARSSATATKAARKRVPLKAVDSRQSLSGFTVTSAQAGVLQQLPKGMRPLYEDMVALPPGVRVSQFNADKDRLMGRVEKRKKLQPGSLELFVALTEDVDLDNVTRDYALQHLSAIKERLINEPGCGVLLSEDELSIDINSVVLGATSEVTSSIAGTALLAAERLAAIDTSLDAQRVTHEALKVLVHPDASPLARATALQFCGVQALPAARSLAASSDHMAEKCAAISCMGRLGGTGEQVFLEEMNQHAAARYRSAITNALAEIDRRNGGDV